MHLHTFLVIFCGVVGINLAVKLPSYIARCALDNPDLNNCIRDSANGALSTLIKGDRKIHMVQLSPLLVNNMFLDVNGGGLRINLTNCNINGLDTMRLVHINWDHNNRKVESEVFIDYTSLVGDYDINGRILVLPIAGQGPCNITFDRPRIKFNYEFELEQRKNKQYVKITNAGFTYEPERAYFRLYNLFDGNEQLAQTMRDFLDENWKDVNREIGPSVGNALALVFSNILQNVFYKIPLNELFIL